MSWSKKLRSHLHAMRDLAALERDARARQLPDGPVVTLTTTPRRIARLKPTLVSLLAQRLPPREVQVNVGLDLFAGAALPRFLDGLDTVKVYRVERDLGPATKFIPALERWAGTRQLLVVVDDDMFYAPDLLASLVAADRAGAPGTCYCANGHLLPRSLRAEDCAGDRRIAAGSRRIAIVQGAGGYTLRPDFVDPAALRNLDGAPERALFDDDVWISGHLSRNDIVKVQVPAGRRKGLVNTIESAIGGDRAALQTALLNYFATDWKDEEYAERA